MTRTSTRVPGNARIEPESFKRTTAMSNRMNKRQHDALNQARVAGNWGDFDHTRDNYYWQSSKQRREEFVKKHCRHLHCMDCGGAGGYKEVVLDDGSGPFHVCGWCDGTGLMTPHERGIWLRIMKDEKRKT